MLTETSPQAHASPPAAARFAAEPGHLASTLAELSAEAEREFLAVGDALSRHASLARDLERSAGEASAAAAAASGRDVQDRLGNLLDRLAGGEHGAAHESAALEAALGRAADAERLDREFGALTRHLRAVGAATRIESARLARGSEAFAALAGEVQDLAESARAQFSSALGRWRGLVPAVTEALARLNRCREAEDGEAAAALGGLRDGLTGLEGLGVRSLAASAALAQGAAQVASRVSSVLRCLQFQDITRQRFEHVAEALGEARDGSAALQRAQLLDAGGEAVDALDRVRADLVSLADAARAADAEVGALADGDGARSSSLLGEVRRELTGVSFRLRRGAERRTEAAAAVGALSAAADEIAASVGAVEDIAEDVQLIALNATIRAAGSGREARTLGVLAQEVQRVSAQVRGRTSALSEALAACRDAAAALHRSLAGALEARDRQSEGALTEIESLVAGVEAAQARLAEAAARARQAAGELSRDAGQVAAAMAVRDRLARRTAELADALEQAEGAGLPGAAYAERYTMERERELHRAVLAGLGAPGAAPELSGNIELF